MTAYFKLFPLKKNASDHAGTSMSCKAHFSFQSLHKLLDIVLGRYFKKQKLIFNEQKMLQTFFKFNLIKKRNEIQSLCHYFNS